MIQRLGASPFIDAAAVEAWDAWFRWRDKGELRDLSVDATWERVATALASVETEPERAAYKHRLLAALSSWRLLPDPRVIATAGTSVPAWSADDLVAVLNVGCFVLSPGTMHAELDLAAIRSTAALAVHMLDNAAILPTGAVTSAERLHIGIIGLGDALALMGIRYDSAAARMQARRVARALAHGCAKGSVALAGRRPPAMKADVEWKQRAYRRGLPRRLIDDAGCTGVRHRNFTSITSQRRLALFANAASDALEPAADSARTYVIEAIEGERRVRSPGYAATLLGGVAPVGATPVAAMEALREAMQAWIDEPIDLVPA